MSSDNTVQCPTCGMIYQEGDVDDKAKCPVCGVELLNKSPTSSTTPPQEKNLWSIVKWLLLLTALGLGGYYFLLPYFRPDPVKEAEKAAEKLLISQADEACTQMEVYATWDQWLRPALIVHLQLHNPTPYHVKDLRILCKTAAANATTIDEKSATVYRVVAAGETTLAPAVDFGLVNQNAVSVQCICNKANPVFMQNK